MKRIVVLTALSIALLALASTGADAASAAAPFGMLGGISRGGNAGEGTLPLTGWALARDGVFAVDVVVDGGIVGRAFYGRSRPGVAVSHPGFPDSAAAGFAYELDTTHFLNGLHTITARIESKTGLVSYTNSRTVELDNVTANLLPFGKIDFPNANDEMAGDCSATNRRTIYSVVDGWTLDPGAQANADGIGFVEMLIDGSLFLNSQNDCRYSVLAGGLSNCFGIRRLDIQQEFPGLKDSPHAGFRFVLDVGALLLLTDSDGVPLYAPGSHEISIRVGDIFEQVTDIAQIPVTFGCLDFSQAANAIGHIDNPVTGLLYSGDILVSGWAVDLNGVQQVIVLLDGTQVGSAFINVPRADITSFFPSYPATPAPGWILPLDTTVYSNGTHVLSAEVIDTFGNNTFIGNFPITIANVIP